MYKTGNRYWLETERFLMKLITLRLILQTQNRKIKLASLALKYILNKEPLATNPLHSTPLNILTSLFHTKKVLT